MWLWLSNVSTQNCSCFVFEAKFRSLLFETAGCFLIFCRKHFTVCTFRHFCGEKCKAYFTAWPRKRLSLWTKFTFSNKCKSLEFSLAKLQNLVQVFSASHKLSYSAHHTNWKAGPEFIFSTADTQVYVMLNIFKYDGLYAYVCTLCT